MQSKAPCAQCTKREVGCHDICPEYQAWRRDLDDFNDKIQKEKESRYQLSAFRKEGINKAIKRQGHRHKRRH